MVKPGLWEPSRANDPSQVGWVAEPPAGVISGRTPGILMVGLFTPGLSIVRRGPENGCPKKVNLGVVLA